MGMRRGPRSGTRLNRAPEERKKIGRLAFIFDLSGDFVLKLDLHLGWTLTSTGAGSKIAQQGRLGRKEVEENALRIRPRRSGRAPGSSWSARKHWRSSWPPSKTSRPWALRHFGSSASWSA